MNSRGGKHWSADGQYIPGLASDVASPLVDDALPSGFNKDHVQGKTKYAQQWKTNPAKVIKVMMKATKEYVNISEESKEKRRRTKSGASNGSFSSKSTESGDEEDREGESRSKNAVPYYRCREQGHKKGNATN